MSLISIQDAVLPLQDVDFIKKHYEGENDILIGLTPATEEGFYQAHSLCFDYYKQHLSDNLGWKKGDIVERDFYREVEFVSNRVDMVGNYYTACICRRFKNPLNIQGLVPDDLNGWVIPQTVKISENTLDQEA